ncbi:hypothetical protein CFC21_031292 [Triticum aestivum]|uniref:KIB1-4 beta-propeller domain-containing protein n=3 Tax=Triticinae TaxID=1648030 RepID=A0A9R1JHS3_WHEAT|nr:hypothetical protein CFC21_031292 [Triticum aestivum]
MSTDGSAQSPQWSDLADDLLGMVHLRLASPRDRLRLTAVCKAWRTAVSRLPAPPPTPLLLLMQCARLHKTKRLCGPDDCWVMRVPDKAEGKLFVGSHGGGWVAALDWSTLLIVNLFSGAEVVVSPVSSPNPIQTVEFKKVIFSEDPASSSCILAAINHRRSYIALCKVGGHESGWTVEEMHDKSIIDISFCNGELYGLMQPNELYGLMHPNEELIKFKINMKVDGTPVIASRHPLAVERRHGRERWAGHLIELHGKPSMAIHDWWLPNRRSFYKVFTLVDTDNDMAYKYKWAEVLNFGDHALFFGPYSSKAVHVTVDMHHGWKRNHIYYSIENLWPTNKLPDDAVHFVTMDNSEHMYCREDPSVGDGVERTGYYVTGCNHRPMWLCPPLL